MYIRYGRRALRGCRAVPPSIWFYRPPRKGIQRVSYPERPQHRRGDRIEGVGGLGGVAEATGGSFGPGEWADNGLARVSRRTWNGRMLARKLDGDAAPSVTEED